MYLIELKQFAVSIHYAGLIPGLLCALLADLIALSSLRRPLGPRALSLLSHLHGVIVWALCLLWASGLAILWLRLGPGGGELTPKLMVKLGMVSLLTLNAVAIGQLAMPQLAASRGRCFGAFPASLRFRLAMIGAVSTACWTSALALGTVKALAPMGFGALALALGPVLLLSLAGGALMAHAAPRLSALGRAARDPRAAHA